MAFHCAQGQTRWVLRNLGALIRLKFSKCHAFWYLGLNKSLPFILGALRGAFSNNAAGWGAEWRRHAPHWSSLTGGPAILRKTSENVTRVWELSWFIPLSLPGPLPPSPSEWEQSWVDSAVHLKWIWKQLFRVSLLHEPGGLCSLNQQVFPLFLSASVLYIALLHNPEEMESYLQLALWLW